MSIGRYRELEASLKAIRRAHGGEESPEEDGILDLMEMAWWELTQEERDQLDAEGPATW